MFARMRQVSYQLSLIATFHIFHFLFALFIFLSLIPSDFIVFYEGVGLSM
jgi:hypothetical protein